MPCGVHASESRKPEARLIKRFHLHVAGSSTSPHGKAGPYPAACLPPFPAFGGLGFRTRPAGVLEARGRMPVRRKDAA